MSQSQNLIKKRLGEYSLKPLLPLELASIKLALRQPDVSADSLKHFYRRDPIFCWHLLAQAWRATRNRPTHPFAADHAMTTLGISGTQQLFAPMRPRQQPGLTPEVVFALSSSLLAAELARNLGEQETSKSQIYWSAMSYRMPETLLWHLQPKAMWRIYYRQLTLPKKLTLFEEAKLGFNLHDWRLAVADEFHLDEQLQLIYQRELPTSPRELSRYIQSGFDPELTPSLKSWHRQEAWLIVLSNALAAAIISPWHPRGVQHLSEILQRLLGFHQAKISSLIQMSVHRVSQDLKASKLMVPAAGWLMQPSKPAFPQWLVNPQITPDKSKIKTLFSQRSGQMPQADISPLLTKLTENAMDYSSSAALVHDGLNALIISLGFSRVSFLGIDYKAQSANTRIALNAKDAIKIRPDFSFKLPTPLSPFIEKQAFKLISREKHQKVWRKLPLEIQKQKVEQFILCSLQPGKRVRALIYLDSDSRACFEPQSVNKVKALFKAINTGLSVRNQAKQTG